MRKYRLKAPAGVVADYFRLFVNRRAYTLQSDRPNPDSCRHYYYRPTDKKTGQGLSLTLDTIRRHIEGEITIALYAINPACQRCKWVATDADYKNALADLIKRGGRRSPCPVRRVTDPPTPRPYGTGRGTPLYSMRIGPETVLTSSRNPPSPTLPSSSCLLSEPCTVISRAV